VSQKLYVIGNGFDLYHGISSRYSDFGKFLKAKDPETYSFVERYFDIDSDFWFEFEERLAYFDTDTLIDDASMFLVGYGADDWSDSYHHDYQYEINKAVEAISKNMRDHFSDWIRQLKIPDANNIKEEPLNIDKTATFLNFNYTPTLQKIYGVPESNILYIHGSSSDPTDRLVLGHGWEPEDLKTEIYDLENEDVRVIEGQEYINDFFRETFKPTDQILKKYKMFFSGLGAVDEILVMGHSLSEVDHAYFYEIIKNVNPSKSAWKISYYKNKDTIEKKFSKFKIEKKLVLFSELKDL